MTESNKRDDSEAVEPRAAEDEPAEAHDTSTDEQQADEQFDPVAAHPDVVELDYEQARDELADVVRRLEAGGLSLEDSLALWERGEALATTCERHLAGAQERVDRALSAVRAEESPAAQQ